MAYSNPEDAKAYARRYAKANPRRRLAIQLRHFYGITVEEYEALQKQQKNRCAVCSRKEARRHHKTGKRMRLCLDHCHETGRVRGLLCSECNAALGKMGDDPTRLRAAAKYLERR